MKTLFITLLLSTVFSTNAQIITIPNKIEIIEQKMTLDNFERNGFKTVIDGEDKIIMKSLIQYAQETYGWKLKIKNDMIFGQDLFSPNFSDKHFMIKTYVAKTDEGKELRFFGAFGTDVYINSGEYNTEANNVKTFIKNFVKQYYSNYINKEVTSKSKDLESANKSLNTISAKISSTDKQINKATIKTKKLDKKKAKAEEKIRKTQETVSTIDNETAGIKKNIESLDKSKETLQKEETIEQEKTKLISTELDVLKSKLVNVNSY